MSKKSAATTSNPKQPWFSLVNIFVVYNLLSYSFFFVAYWLIDLTIIQDVVFFFGSELLLVICVLLYGVILGLFPKKSHFQSRRVQTLSSLS